MAAAQESEPTITPHPVGVNAGDTFDLEVSVLAHLNTTYNVSFAPRSRFSYPGDTWQVHNMTEGDAILFKVRCTVEDGTPDGDFNIAFKVSWLDNTTWKELEEELQVTVGEGARGDDDICSSVIPMTAAAVLGMSVLMVRRSGTRKGNP
jgi:hypothetical protein